MALRAHVDPDERWLLAEMLREAERVVDRVLRVAEEQDDKTEQAIALGVATLGGGLAIATFVGGGGRTDPIGLAILALGATANLLALHRFLDAYLGLSGATSLYVSPDPAWLAERAEDPTWRVETHAAFVLRGFAADFRTNRASILAVIRRRKSGMWLLLAAAAAYAIGAFYILMLEMVA